MGEDVQEQAEGGTSAANLPVSAPSAPPPSPVVQREEVLEEEVEEQAEVGIEKQHLQAPPDDGIIHRLCDECEGEHSEEKREKKDREIIQTQAEISGVSGEDFNKNPFKSVPLNKLPDPRQNQPLASEGLPNLSNKNVSGLLITKKAPTILPEQSETNKNQDKEEGSLVAQASRSAITCVEIDQNKIGQVLSELQTTSFVALCEEMQLLYQVLLNQQLTCKDQIEQRIAIEQQPQIIKQLQEQLRQVNRQIWDFRIAAKPDPTEEDYTRMAAEFRSQYEASYTPEQIKIIQNLVGLKPAYITGFYDENTATGVFGWQVYYRRSLYPDLPADGVVGQETLTAMVAELRKKNRAAADILAQANSSGSNQPALKPPPQRPNPSEIERENQRTRPPGTNEDQCPTKHPGLRICDTLSAVVLQRYEPYNQNYRRFAEAGKGPFGRYMYRSRNAALNKVKQITNSYINPDPYYWRDGASTNAGVCPGEGKHFAIHDKRRERGDTYVSAVLSCPCCESPQGNKIDLYALGPHDTLFEPVAEGDRQTPIGEEVSSQAWESDKRELFTS